VKLRRLHLALAVVGLILPYSQFIPWIAQHHALNMPLFLYRRQLQLDGLA
jgi:hypothetical protein